MKDDTNEALGRRPGLKTPRCGSRAQAVKRQEEVMIKITHANVEDSEEILELQKLAYQSEAIIYPQSAKHVA